MSRTVGIAREDATSDAYVVMLNEARRTRHRMPAAESIRKREQVFGFIEQYIVKHGYPPVIREIAEAVNLSMGGVDYQLEVLRKSGRIERRLGMHRGIAITKLPKHLNVCPLCKQVRP